MERSEMRRGASRVIAVGVLTLVLGFVSCSRDYPIFVGTSGTFPLTCGNWWRLTHHWTFVMQPYSSPQPDTLVYSGQIHWEIIDSDVLAGHRSYVLRNEYQEDLSGSTYVTLDWYANFWDGSNGLFHIGYAGAGNVIPPEPFSGWKFRVGNRDFCSPHEVYLWAQGFSSFQEDTTVRIPPRKVLVYPLTMGKEWVAFDDVWLQVRKVIGSERISTSAGIYTCWKIKVSGETLDTLGIVWYDWFGDEGLVKRYFYSEGFIVDPYGSPIGTWESTETYLLQDYRIH